MGYKFDKSVIFLGPFPFISAILSRNVGLIFRRKGQRNFKRCDYEVVNRKYPFNTVRTIILYLYSFFRRECVKQIDHTQKAKNSKNFNVTFIILRCTV